MSTADSLSPMSFPLFNRSELADAFALIVSRDEAERRARQWFDMFVEDTDAGGRFLYTPPPRHVQPELTEEQQQALARLVERNLALDSTGTYGYGIFQGKSDHEKGEFLIRFSDFHLNLVSLVSSDLAERVRAARGDTPEQAAWRMTQMRKIVAVMRQ